jgi:uncharacterized LabA/DUF88 family protein
MNTIVYIDGYNWYHAIFKHYPEWKWINIQTFFESLRPHDDVVSVKMFSAMIEHDQTALERQQRYFTALQTLPKVKLVLGVFQPRLVTCRADCRRQYLVPEEKKTDVNLAIELVDDAINSRADSICIVSGDSDVQPAVEWVAKNRPQIKILVYVPSLPNEQSTRRTDYYKTKKLNVDCKFLPIGGIKDHQMKPSIKLADGKLVVRPHLWQKEPVILAPK